VQKIRTIIVDDEPLARRGIRAQLTAARDFEIISECRNGEEAVEVIETESPDLLLLDVQMPGLNGFGVVDAIGPARMPAVIFVTAYDRYALHAFEVHALDYLLKPVDDERFDRALQKVRRHLQNKNVDDLSRRLQSLLDDIRPRQQYAERLVVKSAGRILFLSATEVDWIEAADIYVRLHIGTETHLVRETMNSLEARLDPGQFVRIHRSRMVNIRKIKELQPMFRGGYEIRLQNGTRLESGRGYRDRIQKLLGYRLD
jgi:two-component system, LytTR family, response regulator